MSGQPLTFDATPDEMVVFLSEAEEQMELLSQDLLRLEHEGDTNSELLQEIFRAAHTLKGSSGAIGHQRMAHLTHAVESVLDQVRHHTLPVTTPMIDLLLQGVDALRVLLEEVTTLVESAIAIDDLCTGLNALTTPPPVVAQPVPGKRDESRPYIAQPPGAVATAAPSAALWRVEAQIAPECLLPAVRALQVLLALSGLGTVTRSEPTSEMIEAGQVAAGANVTLWLAPHSADDVAAQIAPTLASVLEVTVQAITPEGHTVAATPPVVPGDQTASLWQIAITFNARCQLPAARALQVVLTCATLGTVAASQPTLEEIEAGQVPVDQPLLVTVSAPGPLDAITAAAHAAIERIPEVQVAYVTPVGVGAQLIAPASSATPMPSASPTPSPVSTPLSIKDGEGAGVGPTPASHAPRMVRIDVERLDALMNLVGELVIDRTRLARISGKLGQMAHDPVLAEELTETCRHLARISDDLQDEVMRSRMLPIESVFSKFPRLVRDLAQKVGKPIDFIVEGKDTELDRSVAEQIGDPIIHLLRNSIDHGVESAERRAAVGKAPAGQVRLAARHEENQIVIDVEDDGHGIDIEVIKQKAVSKGILSAEAAARLSDREAVDLIFASGFSTAEQISDISGRGVGMDIVRTNVERLNGSITVETEVGQGTRFTVRLPLTLAIIRALLVEVAGQTYAIPLTSVVEALRIEREALRSINGRAAIALRGQVLPLLHLRDVFAELTSTGRPAAGTGRPQGSPTGDTAERAARQFVVAVRWGERRGGLIVDALVGEQEIVIKPLGNLFRSAQGVSGGAVLGDGQVAPILDIATLIKHIIATDRGTAVSQGAVA